MNKPPPVERLLITTPGEARAALASAVIKEGSHEKVAAKLDCSRTTVEFIIKAVRMPSRVMSRRLLDCYGIPMEAWDGAAAPSEDFEGDVKALVGKWREAK